MSYLSKITKNKIVNYLLIFIMVFSWIFNYPPVIFNDQALLKISKNFLFLPEVKQAQAAGTTLRPTSDVLIEQTPSTAGYSYVLVDEETLSTSDYCETKSTTYKLNLYGFPDPVSEIGEITNVRVYAYAGRRSIFSTTKYKIAIRPGATVYYGNEYTLTYGGELQYVDWATNPDGGNWTWANIDSLAAGISIKSASTSYWGRHYQVYVVVTYTPSVPDAPTNVAATTNLSDKVTVTWTKSRGATGYKVYRDETLVGTLGDVATYDDTGAGAPSITAGSSVASDGTSAEYVALSLSGTSTNDGTAHNYTVKATNTVGDSSASSAASGKRIAGTLTYQWQRVTFDIIPDMTSNSTPSGLASADTVLGDADQSQPWHAFDDENSGEYPVWHSQDTAPHWLQYQFPTTKTIKQYTILSRNHTTLWGPEAWTFNGSNNGTDWTTLDTITGQSFARNEKKIYPISNTTQYSYYRINFTAPSSYVVVGEMEMMESAFSNIGTTASYNDTGAPANGETVSYHCVLSAAGAVNQTSTVDTGYRMIAPTVTTQAGSNVQSTTATGNGTITSTGGVNASAWGVCYKTSSGCTISDSVAAGSGSGGTGAFTASMTGLSPGTTYYIKAYATNAAGTGYGSEVTILTKPAAPTNVSATDGSYTNQVTITWTKSTGATDYHVWRDSTDLGSVGDVATFDDTGASAPTITPGTASASDGTNLNYVSLSLSGASANNGTTHTYKVVASNATGNSADSSTDTGYRGVGALNYQWQRSAADSDADYSSISGGTTASYNDTGAPADGSGRYFQCMLSATGAVGQTSTADRGYRIMPVVSVSVSPTSFNYGSINYNTASSTLSLWSGAGIVATNNGNVTADFYIYGANSTGSGSGWTLAGNTTGNNYIHRFCNDTDNVCTSPPTSYTALTTSPALLKSSVAVSGTVAFQLQVTSPTIPTDFSQQNSVVTIQASAP